MTPIQPTPPLAAQAVESPQRDEATAGSSARDTDAENARALHRTKMSAAPPQADEEATVAKFSIYKPTGVAVVKIVSASTGEVIGEFPTTKVLDALTYLGDTTKALDEHV